MGKICFYLILCSLICLHNLVAAQESERQLRLCSSMGQQVTQILVQDFQARTGIEVQVTYLPAGRGVDRLAFLQEQQFDCWLGGRAEEYYLAAREGMLEPYKGKDYYKLPAAMSSREGYWTGLYLEYIAFISNKERLHELGLYAPTTWQELLLPQLQGELVLADFQNGGATYAMLTSLWQLEGEERALRFAGRLNKQTVDYRDTYEEAVKLVYSGKKAVTVVPLKYALHLEKEHPHLFATVVQDANRNLLTCVAILDGVTHEKEAKELIDYLMTDYGGQALAAQGFPYYWHVKNYPYNNNRREVLGNIAVPVDDLEWTAGSKQEIIKRWLEAGAFSFKKQISQMFEDDVT